MKQFILKTNDSYAPLVLRIVLGLVLLAHGSQKLLGLFGGFGFTGTMNFFTQTMHLPWIIGLLVISIEFLGSIALCLGLYTRLISVAMTVLIAGVILTSHIQYGFFMNWFGSQKGEGIEYFILFLAGAISLVISGGGRYAVDRQLLINNDQQ